MCSSSSANVPGHAVLLEVCRRRDEMALAGGKALYDDPGISHRPMADHRVVAARRHVDEAVVEIERELDPRDARAGRIERRAPGRAVPSSRAPRCAGGPPGGRGSRRSRCGRRPLRAGCALPARRRRAAFRRDGRACEWCDGRGERPASVRAPSAVRSRRTWAGSGLAPPRSRSPLRQWPRTRQFLRVSLFDDTEQ